MNLMDELAKNIHEPTDEEIALGAYRIWLQEGCPHGRDWEHWLKARKELVANKAKEKTSPGGGASSSSNTIAP